MTLCLAHIDERIPGLTATRIPITGGHAIVVRIPTSYRRPHMVKIDAATEFWIRHDRQKSPMSTAEIRTAVLATEDLVVKAEQFITQRRDRLCGGTRFRLILIGTPLLLQERLEVPDERVRQLLAAPPSYRPGAGVTLSRADARIEPTINGLQATEDKVYRLEVFRNGHVEYVAIHAGLAFDLTRWTSPAA